MPPQNEAPPVERQVNIPMRVRAAETLPASYDESDGSIEVVWSTGAAVTRFDWYDGEYYDETLSLDEGAVRLDRLNNGAPFLKDHRASLASVIGSVVRGSARIENGLGIARVRLATTPDVADDVAKIRDGHVSKVSVGYLVHAYEVREPGEGKRTEMRAIDWEPQEISAVAIPADPDAAVRSQDARQGGFPCIVRGRAAPTEEKNMPPEATQAAEQTPAKIIVPENVQTEQQRAASPVTLKRIGDLCERSGLAHEKRTALMMRHAETPLTEEQLSDAITEAYAETRALPQINGAITITADEKDKYRGALAGAFAVRMAGSHDKPKDGGEVFGHMGTLEIARQYLERDGVRTAHMGPYELAGTALGFRHGAMTTSDFAIALQQAGNAVILDSYQAAEDTWRPLAKETSANDFRPTPLVGLTGTAEFQIVAENGEYTYGSFQDIGDSFKLWTSGRIISLSRQLIINDQLGLFGDISEKLGGGAGLHEANSFWANIIGNPVMSDGFPVFSAQHGNLGTGSAITTVSLGVGRAAMRNQKDRDGTTFINITPKYLIVGPNKETEAEAVLTAVGATTAAGANLFAGKLSLIVEPRITDNRWFLLAEPRRAPVVQVAYLRGQRGIYTDTRIGFEVDGVEYKGRLDFNAKAVDYRGGYMNTGN